MSKTTTCTSRDVTSTMRTIRSRPRAALPAALAVLVGITGGGAMLVGRAATADAAPSGTGPRFSSTGALGVPRARAAVAVLGDGDVLVAGGQSSNGSPLSEAELYDPASGAWRATGSMPVPLSQSTATVLGDGDVLLAGGLTLNGGQVQPTGDSVLYDPASGTWAFTKSGMPAPSFAASAALTASGDVLYAGGLTATGASAQATAGVELFDPATGTWSNGPQLPLAVADAQVSPLGGGAVLLAGGERAASGQLSPLSEVYQPSSNSWQPVGNLLQAVAQATVTHLANGAVLVAGGETTTAGAPTDLAQVYDPATGAWTRTGSLPVASYGAVAAPLPSGEVLYAGGMTSATGSPTAAAAVYDAAHGTFGTTASLLLATGYAAVAELHDGDVLVAGGQAASGVTGASELYDESSGTAPVFTSASNVQLVAGKYAYVKITTTGSPAPRLSESGALPPGLSFVPGADGTAVISGTASSAVASSYQLVVVADNGVGSPAVQHLAISFSRAAAITSPAWVSILAGRAVSFSVTGTGLPLPKLSVSGTLPPGLAFHVQGNGTATIAGTVPADVHGSWAVTVVADNGVGNAAVQRLQLVVSVPVAARIITPASFQVQAGSSSVLTVRSSGTPTPTLTESGTLPPGLSFRSQGNGTATISGTVAPEVHGSFAVTVVASNGSGSPAVQTVVIDVVVPTIAQGAGYWYVTSASELVGQGSAHLLTEGSTQYPSEIVAMAATPDGFGYYLLSAYGGVFAYGDARSFGSAEHLHLHGPTVAMAVTPSDSGYYLVTRTGQILHFGDAPFYGSPAHRRIAPVAAFAVTPDGRGYWVVTVTGAVYAFGDAQYFGGAPAGARDHVVAFASTTDGHGYWLVTRGGSVLYYGDAGYFGSTAGRRVPPITAFAPTADGRGYWLVSRRGNVYNFGDARFYGSSAHNRIEGRVVAFAARFAV